MVGYTILDVCVFPLSRAHGRASWYRRYQLRVAVVQRESCFERGTVG